MEIQDLGIKRYADALTLQDQMVCCVRNGAAEKLLLLEHEPVYTIGRGGDAANILDRSIEAVRISRGGDVTYHGPGQLVGYPIIRLGSRGKDLRHYLRFLEEVVIQAVGDFGVSARREPGKTGVWTDAGKLASIGVGVRHWVSMHGFAINVSNNLGAFGRINPCGMADCPVASLEHLCGRRLEMTGVKSRIAEHFLRLLPEWLPEG